jgi:hypothetical protein
MTTAEVYNLFKVPEKIEKETLLKNSWNMTHTSCKDIVALACPLKPLPTSLVAFKQMLSEQGKVQDFVMASFYVIYVGLCDGQQYGWSKAPYDVKNKKREDQKALYTLERSTDMEGETRFWCFKKVSNNMNKGPRIEKIEDKDGSLDLSFVLKKGTCFTMFLREENFDDQKSIFAGTWDLESTQGILPPYKPILLQLSGVNDEQALKGNGFKVRSLAPAPEQILKDFYDCFYESKSELLSHQTNVADHISLKTITKPNKSSPILCTIDNKAFVYKEPGSSILEIVDSGFNDGLGKKLLMHEQVLLEAMNSVDVDRALRMFSVAIGHNAVHCLVAPQEYTPGSISDANMVVHLNVDLSEALWLKILYKSKAGISTDCALSPSLPKTSMLTMCFGKSISRNLETNQGLDDEVPILQWYSPKTLVTIADANGDEFLCHVVFEMMLVNKQMAGQREVSNRLLFMDEVSGLHYVIKVFHAHKVSYSEEDGLTCTNPTLLVTWQFRPGANISAMSVPGNARKRSQMVADSLDFINSGQNVTEYQKSELQSRVEVTNEQDNDIEFSKVENSSKSRRKTSDSS